MRTRWCIGLVVFVFVAFGSEVQPGAEGPSTGEQFLGVWSGTTFESSTAKGTWSVREKANGNDVASGTWAVTRK